MIVIYYILCLLEVFLKAWADSLAFSWGNLYHLADVLHYISLTFIFAYIYKTWNGKVKEMVLLFAIYLLIRFAWFDYYLNIWRNLDFDYRLFLSDIFGKYSGFARIVAMVVVLILGYVYCKDKKFEYHEKR